MTQTYGTATPGPFGPVAHSNAPKTVNQGTRVTKLSSLENGRVTRVTRFSDSALRARTRRPNLKSNVTHVISMLTSDTVTSLWIYQYDAGAHAHAAPPYGKRVTSVTGLEGLSK